MIRAVLDPMLAARVIGERALRYTTAASNDEDRPEHIRAASGLASIGGRIVVAQDDAGFLGIVAGDAVTAIALPRGPGGRRRFEVRLGNKADKLDLESCVVIDDELWSFGSGSTDRREQLCRLTGDATNLIDAAPLYAALRDAIGPAINIEGAAVVGPELWLFHRGNCGPDDRAAIARIPLAPLRRWLDGGALPLLTGLDRFDLGAIAGVRFGFTDAVGDGSRVFYLAAAEASPDAIADGLALGTQLGVIDAGVARAARLLDRRGMPIKAEGLALDPTRPDRLWIVDDPDDPQRPARLCEIELVGPWR